MNVQKMTISMPKYLYDDLLMLVPRGEVSRFVAEATENYILDKRINIKKNPVEAFFAHKKNLPKLTDNQIMSAMRKGRM